MNPLEFIAETRLISLIEKRNVLPDELDTTVIRVDNSCACACLNAGMDLSRMMRRARKTFIRENELAGFEVLAQHVIMEDNTVADMICWANCLEAENAIQHYPLIEWEDCNRVMTPWEREKTQRHEDTSKKKRKKEAAQT